MRQSTAILLFIATATACHPPVTARLPARAPSTCAPQGVRSQPHPLVRDSVVRVVTNLGAGSGFLLSGGTNERLIVTNYHVIEGAAGITVSFGSDAGSQVVAEVAKVDRKNDLALLRVSSRLTNAHGLVLSPAPATLGAEHAVLGYPSAVGLDSTLTYEIGNVSAPVRHMGRRELIQTNANINPGNSGGPAIDGCGVVLGVATLKHLKAERVGLLVPAERVRELVAAYLAPAPSAAEAASGVVKDLFRSVTYRRNEDAAELFSPRYLDQEIGPRVGETSQLAVARLARLKERLQKKGRAWEKMDDTQRVLLVKSTLSSEELLALHVAEHLDTQDISRYAALREFHVGVVSEDFGDVREHRVDRVIAQSNDAAECDVQVATSNGLQHYRFEMAREWGDWVIRAARRVR